MNAAVVELELEAVEHLMGKDGSGFGVRQSGPNADPARRFVRRFVSGIVDGNRVRAKCTFKVVDFADVDLQTESGGGCSSLP